MQSKLQKIISKIDDEIESKILLNDQMNKNTFETYVFLKNNMSDINVKMQKYSLNERYLRLNEYLAELEYIYDEKKLEWFLFRNGYFNEKHKIFIQVFLPLLIGVVCALLLFAKEYYIIVFANATIISTLLIHTVFNNGK